MKKYIWQRILIITTITILILGISGTFMEGFYTKHYTTDVRILSNVESSYNKINPKNTKNHDELGRYVKISYRDNNGETHKLGEFYSYNNYIDKDPGYRYRQLKEHHVYITDRVWLIVIMVILMLGLPIITLFMCGEEMNIYHDYNEEQKISLLRLKIFYWWYSFIGYSKEALDELYEKEFDRIDIKHFKYSFRIKPYLTLRQELKDIIKKQKSQIQVKEQN